MSSETNDIERVRHMAERLDCIIEEDFQLLAGATANTVEAWRKRGKGPAYIRLGTSYLYPLKGLAEHLESLQKTRNAAPARGTL